MSSNPSGWSSTTDLAGTKVGSRCLSGQKGLVVQGWGRLANLQTLDQVNEMIDVGRQIDSHLYSLWQDATNGT